MQLEGKENLKFFERVRLAKAAYYWNRKKVVFIHIPKAAGVSASFRLYERNLGHWPLELIRKYHPRIIEKLPILTIVRDPISRFVSAYQFATRGGGDNMQFQFFDTIPDHCRKDINIFVEYIFFDATYMLKDFIFLPQCFFLDSMSTLSNLIIFKIEYLEEFWNYLYDNGYCDQGPIFKNVSSSREDDIKILNNRSRNILEDYYINDFRKFYS